MILLFTTATAGLLGSLFGAAVVAAITDPEWATPLNTLLLLVIAVLAGHNGRSLLRSERRIEQKVEEAQETAGSAAEAAAAAAEASAAAARITRELGGAWRHVDPPLPKTDAGTE